MKIICAFKDNASETFGPSFEVRAIGEALRVLKNELAEPLSQIYKHPNDFELYKLAMYNEQTGEIQGMKPERINRAIDLIEQGA